LVEDDSLRRACLLGLIVTVCESLRRLVGLTVVSYWRGVTTPCLRGVTMLYFFTLLNFKCISFDFSDLALFRLTNLSAAFLGVHCVLCLKQFYGYKTWFSRRDCGEG